MDGNLCYTLRKPRTHKYHKAVLGQAESLVKILLVIPAIHHGYLRFQGLHTQGVDAKKGRLFDVCVLAFAVGVLMSTAFFLVMPHVFFMSREAGQSFEKYLKIFFVIFD